MKGMKDALEVVRRKHCRGNENNDDSLRLHWKLVRGQNAEGKLSLCLLVCPLLGTWKVKLVKE